MFKQRAKPYGKAIGQVLTPMITPIFKKNGFTKAEIILDWRAIVGEEFGGLCDPVRISNHQERACLYIRASKSVATQLVYSVPIILEKINRYFGFKAVTDIKFLDDGGSPPQASVPPEKPQLKKEKKCSINIDYAPLADALSHFFDSMH